jgi:hypothetical protein
MINDEIRPSYVSNGREYYNFTASHKYVSMTDTGFRKRIKRIEKDHGIAIPVASRSGNQKFLDGRILDHFRKPTYDESKWLDELREIVAQINSER